ELPASFGNGAFDHQTERGGLVHSCRGLPDGAARRRVVHARWADARKATFIPRTLACFWIGANLIAAANNGLFALVQKRLLQNRPELRETSDMLEGDRWRDTNLRGQIENMAMDY